MNIVKLGEFINIDSGFAFKSSFFNDKEEGLPIIRIRDVNSGKTSTFYSGEYEERFVVNDGDLLITMDGEFNIKEWRGGRALLNQRVCRIKSGTNTLNERYLLYLLPKVLKSIEDKTPFATVKHLSVKDIKESEVFIPSLDIQEKIVKILDIATNMIDARLRQIKLLSSLTQSMFLEMFGDPVKNEKGWEVFKLSEVGELKRGLSKHRPRNAPELLNGPYPLVQTGDVRKDTLYISSYNKTYSELGLKQSKLWPKGTLCITIAANIAQTGILSFDACFPDSVVAFIPKKTVSNVYVHYWFTFFQKIIEANAPESAQKNINLKILRELEVVVPPIEQQMRFEQIVNKIEEEKKLLQESYTQLEYNFDSLMHRGFSGELFND